MSDRSSPSGPSHSAIRTCVAQSRPRPGSIRTAASHRGPGRASAARRRRGSAGAVSGGSITSAGLVGEAQALAGLGVARVVLPADELDGPRRAARGLGDPRRQLGMVAEPASVAAHPRPPADERSRPSRMPAWPSACTIRGIIPASPLPASWSRPASSTSGSSLAAGPERRDDVEPVAPVGDVHAVEHAELGWAQPGRDGVSLPCRHAGEQVALRLANLRQPPRCRARPHAAPVRSGPTSERRSAARTPR